MEELRNDGGVSVTRREVLENAAWIGADAALATGLPGRTAMAEEAPSVRPPAYRGEHSIRPLPFDPTKLKGLSEKLLTSHHDNNYAGAVKRLNLIQQQLGVLDLYEHAYHMDYGAATKAYLDAFLTNVLWDEVNRRVANARAKGKS